MDTKADLEAVGRKKISAPARNLQNPGMNKVKTPMKNNNRK
jgi:hypothetical protein